MTFYIKKLEKKSKYVTWSCLMFFFLNIIIAYNVLLSEKLYVFTEKKQERNLIS